MDDCPTTLGGAVHLLRGKFSEQVICKEECRVSTRLIVPGQQAARLGFRGARRGRYFEVGRVEDVRLDALRWTRIRIPLNAEAKRRFKRARNGVDVHGQVIASSTESGPFGQASWIRTCKWRRR